MSYQPWLTMMVISSGKGKAKIFGYKHARIRNSAPILFSRAIAKYLVGKYAKNDDLYPTDFYTRLEVDRILDFDLGTVFRRATDYFVRIVSFLQNIF